MLCVQPVLAADDYGIAYEEEITEQGTIGQETTGQETIEQGVEESTEEKQTGGVEISAPSAIQSTGLF